jgi:hypothetical protein
MREEILEQVAALLADGLGDEDNLDALECRLTRDLRKVGQRALQRKLEGKKGATKAAASAVGAEGGPGSSRTAREPS